MDRKYINDHQIVERYLQGKLAPGEAQAFEEFYLHDEETLEDLNAAKLLMQHLADIPEVQSFEEASSVQGKSHGTSRIKKIPRAAAMLGTIAAGLAGLTWLGFELSEQQSTIASLSQPSIGTEIYSMEPTRSAEGFVDHEIRIRPNQSRLVFALAVAPPEDDIQYTVRLSDNNGRELWRQAEVSTNTEGDIVVSALADQLSPNAPYLWEVLREQQGALIPFQTYVFHIAKD